jgi:hypothetical protein
VHDPAEGAGAAEAARVRAPEVVGAAKVDEGVGEGRVEAQAPVVTRSEVTAAVSKKEKAAPS